MSKIKFRQAKLSSINMQRLNLVNSIIEEYQQQGYRLTLRQLYYQLVSRDIIENQLSEYQKLSTLLKEGRMGGLVDWNAIEDRLRKPYTPFNVESASKAIEVLVDQFSVDRMEGQPSHVEVWVEKDALSGVLSRVTEQYHVPISVNRGYSSVTAMYASYKRFKKAILNDQSVVLLYLGDFDPSGLDMIRDIKERMLEFMLACNDCRDFFKGQLDHLEELNDNYMQKMYEYIEVNGEDGAEITSDHQAFDIMYMLWISDQIETKPIALTLDQIDQYNPPPNPAKITDPRAKDYIKKYGKTSFEVDALKPEVLHDLLEKTIRIHLDLDLYQSRLKYEEEEKQKLINLIGKI